MRIGNVVHYPHSAIRISKSVRADLIAGASFLLTKSSSSRVIFIVAKLIVAITLHPNTTKQHLVSLNRVQLKFTDNDTRKKTSSTLKVKGHTYIILSVLVGVASVDQMTAVGDRLATGKQ